MGKKSKNKKKQKLKQESNTKNRARSPNQRSTKKTTRPKFSSCKLNWSSSKSGSRRPTPALSLFSKDEMLPAKAA